MDGSATPAVQRAIPPTVVTRLGNPVLTWLLSGPRRAARVGRSLLLLHITGRRTGTVYTTPVAYHRQPDGSLLVLTSSRWRVNLRGSPTPVDLTVLGRRVAATAVLQEDPFAVAKVYLRLIGEVRLDQAGRRLGIRITVDRAPTYQELVEAVQREHLSVLHLVVSADQP